MARTTVETYDPAAVAPAELPRPPSGSGTLSHGARVGRYVVLSVIGRGGMGVVYAAHDPQLDRQVALKLIRTAEHPEEAERLVREAQALAKLSDPYVVAVHDAGEVDGQVFVAMQLVDGEDLATALQKRRRSEDWNQVLAWFRDAGRGLAAAHAARLVHRDFKPSNVLIDKRGHASVTDFGIAREQGRSQDPERRALSSANKLMGTPAYMAPEQHALDRATEASDQFAFCVSLWEALFDQHPFVADRAATSSVEIGIAIFEGKLIPPRRRGRVPRRVIDALERGLSREPAERWPSMTALVAELEPVRRRRSWPIAAAGAGAVTAVSAALALWVMRAEDGAAGCALHARVAEAWTLPMHAAVVRSLAVSSTQPYRAQVASELIRRLDAYAARLDADAGEACAARSGRDDAAAAGLAGCVGERSDELAGFVAGLDPPVPAMADVVLTVERDFEPALPCPRGVAASAEDAGDTAAGSDIAFALGRTFGRAAVGDPGDLAADLQAQIVRARHAHLPVLEARAGFLRGALEVERDDDAEPVLEDAIVLGTAHQLDELVARAWILLMRRGTAAEFERASVATRGATARTGDRHLIALAAVYEGIAIVGSGDGDTGDQECRPFDRDGPGIDDEVRHLARMCRISAGRLGRADVAAEIAADLDALAAVYGAGHPIAAETILERGAIEAQDRPGSPQFDAGVRDLRAGIAMLERQLSPPHIRLARAYDLLGQFEAKAGHRAEAAASYLRAEDAAYGLAQFYPSEVALIYVHRAQTDPTVALDRIERAETLRASATVLATHAIVAADAHLWDEAFVAAKRAQAAARLDDPTTAQLQWALARATLGVHGDAAEARRLAVAARATLAKLGDAAAVAAIDDWLVHPAAPR